MARVLNQTRARRTKGLIRASMTLTRFIQRSSTCMVSTKLCVYTATSHPEGEFGEPGMKYNIAKDLGIVAFGRHQVSVDAALFSLFGLDPQKIKYLKLGKEVFGAFDRIIAEMARPAIGDWFAFRVPF